MSEYFKVQIERQKEENYLYSNNKTMCNKPKNMTKKEAVQKLKELQDYIENYEDDIILVPENIKIEANSGYWDGLWIQFNGNRQKLLMAWNYGLWNMYWVYTSFECDRVKCKLIRVDKKDLKVWYTYYASNKWLQNIDELFSYNKYLGDGKFAYINHEINVCICDSWIYWQFYQVVPLED